MESRRSSGANGSRDGADAVGDAFQLVAQGLVQGMAQLQEALRQQRQEAERKVQEALQLYKPEAEQKIQEAERRMQEALRLQEERLREVERKLQEKDAAIRALRQRLEERLTAVEERTTASEGSGGKGGVHRLEGRVEKVEASLQRAVQKFTPHVDALLRHLEKPQFTSAFPVTAASTREAPATGGAAADGGEESPTSNSSPSPSGAGHQGAAAEEEDARQRVELRIREVELRVEEAQTSPFPLGEQLFDAADYGRLRDVRRLTDSGADVNYTDSIGYTPLINAAMKESVEVVSLLLQRSADPNAVNCSGDSVLHFAAMRNRSGRCVELLVRAGADVNARNWNGETPLHRAAHQNNKETAGALLAAGARRDLKPWVGRFKHKSPLEIARFSRIKDLLRL